MSSLKNTPWQYGVDSDGTCDIYATENKKEGELRWIGSAIDEETAKAIADLPETLSELERVREAGKAVLKSWDFSNDADTIIESINNLKKALEE